MLSTRERGVLGALLISLAVVACGGSTATTAPGATAAITPPPAASLGASAPAATSGAVGTTGRIVVADKGFAVTLPDGWHRVDASGGDLTEALEGTGVVDPALIQQYAAQVQAMEALGLSVFALGPDPDSGTTLMILATPHGGMTLDLLDQINSAALEGQAAGGLETERVTLPAGDAIHYRYAVAAGGGTSPAVDTYLLIAGDNQVAVTVTGAAPADAEAIVNSIEILD